MEKKGDGQNDNNKCDMYRPFQRLHDVIYI